MRICSPDTNKIAVCFTNGSGHAEVRVATISGTTPTWGTVETLSANTCQSTRITSPDTDKIVVAYVDVTSVDARVNVCTISGTTITAGSPSTFNSGSTTHNQICSPDTDKIAVSYKDSADSNKGKVNIATISGTTPTWGGEDTFNNAATDNTDICVIDTDKIVVAYKDGNDLDHGYARVATISGTTPTWGTATKFLASAFTFRQ